LSRSRDIVYKSLTSSVFNTITSRSSRLGAINVSFGRTNFSSCPTFLNNTFFDLSLRKTPVVAATGNGGVNARVAFPACAPDVISVATTQRVAGPFPPLISSTAVWDSDTDFFAEGFYIPYDNQEDPDLDGIPNANEVGSSFAAPRVAAAFAILRGENSLATVDELKGALASASFDLGLDVRACRNGVCLTFPFVNNTVINRAVEIVRRNSTVPLELEPLELDIELPNLFGWNFEDTDNRFGVGFEVGALVLSDTSSLELSFDSTDIDYVGELQIYFNGSFVSSVERSTNDQFARSQIMIPSSLISDGANTLEFRVDDAPQTWAVRNILLRVLSDFDNTDTDEPVLSSESEFGDAFGGERIAQLDVPISFFEERPTPTTYLSNEVVRDLRVTFTTKYDRISGTRANSTLIQVNGVEVDSTPRTYSRDEIDHELYISGRHLGVGTSVISFSPDSTNELDLWGIKSISIDYIDPIDISENVVLADRYGYQESPPRFTGLRANFQLLDLTADYNLSLVGWDIDTATELEVYLNGNSLGFLSSSFTGLNMGDSFNLNSAELIDGVNQLEFVNNHPSDSERFAQWGVEQILIQRLESDLQLSDLSILENVLSPVRPFTFEATLSNLGQAASNENTSLVYLVSTDDIISLDDFIIGSTSIDPLGAGESRIISERITTEFVNKNLYFGLCLRDDGAASEAVNVCSSSVFLDRRFVISPIMELLLN